MNTTVLRIDKPPIVTPAMRQRAYARLFATAIYCDDQRKREAARNAIKLLMELRQDCKERNSA